MPRLRLLSPLSGTLFFDGIRGKTKLVAVKATQHRALNTLLYTAVLPSYHRVHSKTLQLAKLLTNLLRAPFGSSRIAGGATTSAMAVLVIFGGTWSPCRVISCMFGFRRCRGDLRECQDSSGDRALGCTTMAASNITITDSRSVETVCFRLL